MKAKIVLKAGVVVAGYVIALLLASVAAYLYDLSIDPADAQTSAGMYAFGEFMYFLGVFGFLSLGPTGLALYFLRPSAIFWTAFSVAGLTVAIVGPIAAAAFWHLQTEWLIACVVWLGQVTGAPLLALGFLLAALLAPAPRPRWLLVAAATIEGVVSAYVFGSLFVFQHWL